MRLGRVIFDLDGTLVDSQADVVEILEAAFASQGRGQIRVRKQHIGPPVHEMVRLIVPDASEADRAGIVAEFRRRYDSSTLPRTQPFLGVLDCLREFHQWGLRQYIATNKPRIPTQTIITKLFPLWIEDFRTVDFDGPTQKLDKQEQVRRLIIEHGMVPDSVVVVGDSPSDIQAAEANGCRSVAVTWGYCTAEELHDSHPDWVANHPKELQELVRQACQAVRQGE